MVPWRRPGSRGTLRAVVAGSHPPRRVSGGHAPRPAAGGAVMNETAKRAFYWAPRILCIAFAAFLTIFATDVFTTPYDFWHRALALLMHLVPSAIVLAVLAVVWRWEWVGVIAFPLLAVYHLVGMWGRLDWT